MQSSDQDQLCTNSIVAAIDDEQVMTLSTNWRKSTFYRRSAPFRKYQIGRLSARRPGIVLIKNNINVAKQSQGKIVIDNHIVDDNVGYENPNNLFESLESQGENEPIITSSVQDIINYFESKTGAGHSISAKNPEVGTPARTSLAKASTEIKSPLEYRKWSEASISCESSQTSIDDRASVSVEGCSSAYEWHSRDYELSSKMEPHAEKLDICNIENSELCEGTRRRFDHRSNLAIPDDVIFLSERSSEVSQSNAIKGGRYHQDLDLKGLSLLKEHEGINSNKIAFSRENEFEFNLEHYLLAYENTFRGNSESMRHMPSSNMEKQPKCLTDLERCERQILAGDMNRTVDPKNFTVDDSFMIPQRQSRASDHPDVLQAREHMHMVDLDQTVDQNKLAIDDSFIIPQRRGASDPILRTQEHAYKDLDEIISQGKNSRAVEERVCSDSFIVPERSVSNKRTERIWKNGLDIDTVESTSTCNSSQSDAYNYAQRQKQKDKERPVSFDELAMMPDRNLGKGNSTLDMSRAYPFDCDVEVMNTIVLDSQQSSTRKEENSGVGTREQRKTSPALPGLTRTTARKPDPRRVQRDIGKVKSQLPARSVQSLRNITDRAFRAANSPVKSIDQVKKEREETARKRIEDMRLKREQRNAVKTNIASSNRSLNIAKVSANSVGFSNIRPVSRLPSHSASKAKISTAAKPSGASSPITGKLAQSRRETNSQSGRSSSTDSHKINARVKERSQITVANPSIVAQKPLKSSSVPACARVPGNENGKPLQSLSTSAIMRQQNASSRLPQVPEVKLKIREDPQ